MILNSTPARNTDPLPWVYSGFGNEGRSAHHIVAPVCDYAPRPEYTQQRVHAANAILTEMRIEGVSADTVWEWLFQLARHWALWQSPRIGAFPLDYRDPSGAATQAESEETGEDAAYWTINSVLQSVLRENGVTIIEDQTCPDWWTHTGPERADNIVQDMIVHAVAVLNRWDDLFGYGADK